MTRKKVIGLLNGLIALKEESNKGRKNPLFWDNDFEKVTVQIRVLYPEYKTDIEVVRKMLRASPWDVEYAPKLAPALKADKEIAIRVLEESKALPDGSIADFVLPNAGDRGFCLKAVRMCPEAYQYISGAFQDEVEFGMALIAHEYHNEIGSFSLTKQETHGRYAEMLSPALKKNREVVLEAFKRSHSSLHYADKSFKNDGEFILELIPLLDNGDIGWFNNYASRKLRKDPAFIIKAIKLNPRCYEGACGEAKESPDVLAAYQAALNLTGQSPAQ